MKGKFILALAIIFAGSSYVLAQFPQMERSREKMEASERATAEKERAEKEEAANKPKWPPAKMNVDVQMVLTRLEYKTFAEAKPYAVSRVVDGDPLWLYVKFNGALERYVYTMREENGKQRYILFAEIGPQGDVTPRAHYLMEFDKEELKLPELKISLSPGKAGHNKSLPLFIKNAGNGKPGLWNNELRLTNFPALPRGLNDHLAKVGVVCDFTGGLVKYRKILGEYDSMTLRGTTDESRMPIVGKFDDPAVRTEVTSRLKAEGITISSLYFAADNWAEYSDIPYSLRQIRSVSAAFTYQNGKDCFYGVANVLQNFDAMNNRFGESTINLRKDIAIPCTAPSRMS